MATASLLPQSPSFKIEIAGSGAQNEFTAFLSSAILECNLNRTGNKQQMHPGMSGSH